MRVNSSTSSAVQNSASAETTETTAAKKTQGAAKASATQKAKATESASIEGSARTEISGKAKEMAHAKQVAANAPDVREEKIAALREKILAKKYNVDANAVADKLVDEHISMASAGIG